MSVSGSSAQSSKPVYAILIAISLAHLINDMLQAVIPAIYPRLEDKFGLSMAQIGMITLCYQLSASIFQPVVGAYTDKNPKPFSQIAGMFFTMAGICLLAYAPSYGYILDRKSTRLNSSHVRISYAVFCLKKKIIC